MSARRTAWVFLLAVATAAAQQPAPPAIALHGLLGDHMVLPQEQVVSVSGRAAPDSEVALEAPWLEQPVRARTDAHGRFVAPLRTPVAGGPFRLALRCGESSRVLDDVCVGDVWLASGQSNMEMPLGAAGGWRTGVQDWERAAAAADLPRLRLYTVPQRAAAAPQDDVLGEWQVCTPATAAAFSAVAFYFGRDLQEHRGEPLGLVVSSWGGTVCEAWTSGPGLSAFPEFAAGLAALVRPRDPAAFWAAIDASTPKVSARAPMDLGFDDSAWSTVEVPQPWSAHGLGDHDGVAWYRRVVDVPAAWAGRDLVLSLGAIDDLDTVWFAGERVGSTTEPGRWQRPRDYHVDGKGVSAGGAAIVVCVVDTGGEGGFRGSAEAMRLQPTAGDAGAVGLSGTWRWFRGAPLRELPSAPSAGGPNRPSVLWNGMVAPLAAFPFRGALWYQGESNRERAAQYRALFPAMIRDWRRAFGRELPFLFVQIAPYGYGGDTGQLFALRLAQEAALELPATGMAASTDVGDAGDIHPRQKQPIGERLARLGRRLVHGDASVAAIAPRPARVVGQGKALRLEFDASHGALRTSEGGPRHFEVAGQDGVFHAATATIDGGAVLVQSDRVEAPRSVRYCHAAAAISDLWDAHGLPAVPFVAAMK